MAIIGTHALLYTTEPEEVRAIFRDVFGFDFVDAHDGWLIFALPPAELGVHPEEVASGTHAVSLMCDDLDATVAELRAKGLDVDPAVHDAGYGIVSTIHLPGGLDLQLYQPRHRTAI